MQSNYLLFSDQRRSPRIKVLKEQGLYRPYVDTLRDSRSPHNPNNRPWVEPVVNLKKMKKVIQKAFSFNFEDPPPAKIEETIEEEDDANIPLIDDPIKEDIKAVKIRPRQVFKTQSENREHYGKNFLPNVRLNLRFNVLYKFIKKRFTK